MIFEVKFDKEGLEYEYIEIYRDDEDFDEEEKINEMWAGIEGLFDDVEEFVRKYTGREGMAYNAIGSADGVDVHDLTEEECETLLKHKEELLGGFIVDIQCLKKTKGEK